MPGKGLFMSRTSQLVNKVESVFLEPADYSAIK
jgi:hypothetical protein